ncbi:hypothetical protein FJZ31_13455 [Candidatus Poribacteria bacterium]|nr:hypothetical protein [Candidatus Poribacteria bacterium]
MKPILTTPIVSLLALMLIVPALAVGQTEETLLHHLQAVGEGDIDAIMADYAEDAMLFTPNGALHGHDEIRALFEAMVAGVLPPGSSFEMSQQIIEGEIAYIVWSAESVNYSIPFGTDTFVIRDGKIMTQTFAALMLTKAGGEASLPTLLELPESAEKDVLMHHLQAIGEGNIDAIMADYAEDAVLFTPNGALHGHNEIRALFEAMVAGILPPGSNFEMLQQIIEGEIAYIVWSAESVNYNMPLGTDTFIIRDGKIQTQTFAAQMEVKPVLPEKVPVGHHKLDIFYEFVQDYASAPEERPDGLYLVSTQEAVFKTRSFTLTFDDGAVVELTGIFRGQHQELKVIFDEKGVPVKGVGPSYGTAELFDEDGNILFRGTYTAEDEVLFSPNFEVVGFSSKIPYALTLGQGPYAGYLCSGPIEVILEPDPQKPGEFILHGVGDAIISKLPSITEVPEEDYTRVFFASLSSGLNMISLPLKPRTPYTARSFAEYLGSTVVIKLDEKRQRFVGFTIDDLDDGFPIEGSKGYIVNVKESKVVSFVGAAWTNQPPVSASPPIASSDATWAFVLSGYLQSEAWDGYVVKAMNMRTGAIAIDTVVGGRFAAVWADLSRNSVVQEGDKLEITLLSSGKVIAKTVISVSVNNIRRAFSKIILAPEHFIPRSFALLQNYPNPFNPETWVPYQLAEDANVHISIYHSAGQLVRVLSIGQMQAGSYITKDRAAYWDGRNKNGERVGSGVYFYHLRVGDFHATRRMLIVK